MDAQYQSDGEPDDSARLHNEVAADNGAEGRRIAPGKWGSIFWNDCQPLDHQSGSDSGQDLKSDRKNLEGSEYNSSDDRDDRLESEDDEAQLEVGKAQRGHSDVPADEMLSDEYYEQDGEEQSDTTNYRGFSNSVGLNTRPQSKPVSVSTTVSSSSRALNNCNYDDEDDDDNNDDADADYEGEEEEDEDDADDVDFEPDYGVASSHAGNKDKNWVGEDSEEEDNSDGDVDVSDEDDSYYKRKHKDRQRVNVGRNVKPTRERKSSNRQKRGRSSFEEDEYSAEDSDSESDGDFKSMARRGGNYRKNNARSNMLTSMGRNSEVRTSSRFARKVSYVESEESEEINEGKKKKMLKEEAEEEDGDSIEKNAQQIPGPFLVVVPLSTLSNWAKEFRKWLPDMNVIVYVGTRASREVCQQYEFYNDKKIGRPIKFNTLLTTYEVVLKDKAVPSKIRWNYLMVDEAHRLKNSEAQLYTTLSEFSTKNKLLITGTPLQNSVEELWALLHFLDPDKFKSKDDFVRNYKNLSFFNEIELANLHMELRPHILRRVIKDVEKSLPPKIERILRVEMSPLQKQYYKWILEHNFHDLNKGVRGNQVSLLNIVVELKKCCNHPFLFESADHGYGGDTSMNDISKLERIILSSGKLVILDKLLIRLHETKHRVLIFSQMVRMLDILAEYMSFRGFQFQRLDGSTKAELRQQAMDHFNAPGSDDFCFLLSTRAGGLGINLATADTVIIFDSDWNPQNDLQVLDHLVIQKLNAEGRLERKETKKGSYFDKNELSAILRFGAEELFKEDRNDEESKKRLLSMDIDEILERAEQVEEKEGEEQENELLSAFKVANFFSAEDDGTFWSRWIKSDAIAQAKEALAPRAARNTKSYAETCQPERSNKRKKKGSDPQELQERVQKCRKAEYSVPLAPMIEGATAQVRGWSYGNLPKRDALRFSRAVMKFGNESQITLIAEEVGGAVVAAPLVAQIELFKALVEGCREAVEIGNVEPKGPLLDFFCIPVKANDLFNRVQELQLLAKRISRYEDPIKQFRVLMYLKPSNWSKGCGWNQNERLGLTKKIAPAELQHHETFLPRAPNLKERANALLEMEVAAVGGKNAGIKAGRKASKKEKQNPLNITISRGRDKKGKLGSPRLNFKMSRDRPQRPKKVEPLVKEGEMSDNEEVYEQFKEVKWMEWCEDVMIDEIKTLRRLQRLQTTSADLPKDKVLLKIRNYLQLLGRRIDQIVLEHEDELYRKYRMTMRLWNYVSTFSNLSGERLHQIYSKLKQEQEEEGGVVALPYQRLCAWSC
ncbi:hypothetical protein CRYUN_Cryun25bG0060400 [Craigia yunnanensis]